MVSSIKRITLEYFKEFQDQGDRVEMDLVKMTMQLQSRIITDILVGKGYSMRKITYEKVDGSKEEILLYRYIDVSMEDNAKRLEHNPLLLFAPSLFQKEITKLDGCCFRNAGHLRDFI